MDGNTFGQRLKELRMQKRLTLREYCRHLGKDAGNVSRIERGLSQAPKDEEIVKEYGQALGLLDNSEEMKDLLHLAAIESRQIPTALMEDKDIVASLPLFFRTVTGSKLERDKLIKFLEDLRKT